MVQHVLVPGALGLEGVLHFAEHELHALGEAHLDVVVVLLHLLLPVQLGVQARHIAGADVHCRQQLERTVERARHAIRSVVKTVY